MAVQMEKKEQQRTSEDKKRIGTLERRIKELESSGVKPAAGVSIYTYTVGLHTTWCLY